MDNVVCFPLHRRAALVAETRDLINRKPADAAGRFWRMTVRRLEVELSTYGVVGTEAHQQLESFAAAVFGPFTRETHGGDAA